MVNLEHNPKKRVVHTNNEEQVPDVLIREPFDPEKVYLSTGEPARGV